METKERNLVKIIKNVSAYTHQYMSDQSIECRYKKQWTYQKNEPAWIKLTIENVTISDWDKAYIDENNNLVLRYSKVC